MSLKQFNPRTAVLIAFIVLMAVVRIIFASEAKMTPLATLTPLGAMALFGGAYFSDKWKAVLFPLITLWLSDIILNRYVYYNDQQWRILYEGFYWTYGSFALIALAGKWIIKKANIKNIVVASFVAVLIHWIGTSPGCFMVANSDYPYTVQGYLTSLVVAIPYEQNFLFGTLIYSGIFFGGFEWLQRRYTALRLAA